jgi:anti-anti-sigma factor
MFSVELHAGATVIHVHSDVDVASSLELDTLLRFAEGNRRRIVVSIAAGNSCYAAGLSVLALAHDRLGASLVLVAPAGSRFARTLAATGFSKLVRTVPTLHVALCSTLTPMVPLDVEE